MRMMMKVKMGTEAGSRAVADGSMQQVMQQTLSRLSPEASYFGAEDGARTAFIVFDLKDPAQMPVIAEPLFSKLGATLQIFPVMNLEDLQKGLQQIAQSRS